MKTRTKIIILSAGFLISLCLIMYPIVSAVFNSYAESLCIAQYEEAAEEIEDDIYAQMLRAAEEWNEKLSNGLYYSFDTDEYTDDEVYESLLDVNGSGMMAYIIIPKIDVSLPVYHYSTSEILEKGAGHMPSSSLPVGGSGTHCVISAHTGLPSAVMFTDLDQLGLGDMFYLKVLGETLAYVVTEIKVVEPDDTSSLLPVEGEDLCTLVTCTPYGVNSHRLLVTGTRTDYEEEEENEVSAAAAAASTAAAAVKTNRLLAAAAAAESFIFVLLIIFIVRSDRKRCF